jgi:hypothetical protein
MRMASRARDPFRPLTQLHFADLVKAGGRKLTPENQAALNKLACIIAVLSAKTADCRGFSRKTTRDFNGYSAILRGC